jgi:hypothetical protein
MYQEFLVFSCDLCEFIPQIIKLFGGVKMTRNFCIFSAVFCILLSGCGDRDLAQLSGKGYVWQDDDERRERLNRLLGHYPFSVTDLRELGPQVTGVYLFDCDQIQVDFRLANASQVECLATYLHELVHAGVCGTRLRLHNERFCAELERIYAEFNLDLTEAGRDYATHETAARQAARQPSWLGILGVVGFVAGGIYLWINSFPGWQAAIIFGCAPVTMLLEKMRMKVS